MIRPFGEFRIPNPKESVFFGGHCESDVPLQAEKPKCFRLLFLFGNGYPIDRIRR
jgi:hypothetical protein